MEWLFALFSAALPLLLLAACPAAMYLMMRGSRRGEGMAGCAPADELRRLPAAERLSRLERQQAELAREIASAKRELADGSSKEQGTAASGSARP